MRLTLGRIGLLGLALVVSACAVNGLSFARDERIQILRPEQNEEVSLPFTVTWTAENFDGYFAIFFDRAPMRPNRDLLSLVPEEDVCRVDSKCPDADWLADRNIYVTDGTSLEVARLPDRRASDRSKDRRDLTIVLLDENGRRSGESAFTREFIVERER